MNKQLKNLIWDECTRHDRYIHIPGIYRHFKQTKNHEDMIYAVSNISIPIDESQDDFFREIFVSSETDFVSFYHTELEEDVILLKHKGNYYHHCSYDSEKLVIYTALYGYRESYVRPLSMFISKVDKVKYKDSKQKYRFELVCTA